MLLFTPDGKKVLVANEGDVRADWGANNEEVHFGNAS